MAAKVSKNKKVKTTDVVKKLANELLDLIGIKAEVSAEEDEENEAVLVNIDSETEAGILIGNRGRTLLSIQTILALMLKEKQGEWTRVVVNVADWREKEEDRLKSLAQTTAERTKSTGEPQYLYNLNASQRRIVHLALSEDKEVTTESQGEGKDRFLVVAPKE